MKWLIPGVHLVERIGEGGIADVFRAEWHDSEVAVKVLRDPERPSMRRRFLREGYLLERLQHPGLVRCLSVLSGDQPALVLELLKGETLDVRVGRSALGAEGSLDLAVALLQILQYLHEHGVVHRDVKASNVFCAEGGRVVLIDLGLAADPADPLATTLGDVLGTYAYMAPEQIAGAESDHRCDLYSLGVTLYEAITSQRPFHARGAAQYLQVHRQGGATPLVEVVPGVPPRLAGLVDRLMARDPAARPASAGIALALLTGHPGARRGLGFPALVGREAAVGAIAAVLDGGGVIRVSGQLGSGLGAVARAARDGARGASVEQLTLRCHARTTASEALEVLARQLGHGGPGVSPDLAGVSSAIAALAAESGRLLLVAEDLDLAAPEVAATVAALAKLPAVATVVTGTLLGAQPAGRELVLRPLVLAEVRQLVAGMLGTPAVPFGLDVALYEASGGLPALVVLLLREQVERGVAYCDGIVGDGLPRWSWDPSSKTTLGAGAAARFAQPLAALSPPARALLDVLAVAGGPVPMDIALRAAGVDDSGADLGLLLRAGLAREELEQGREWVSLRRAVVEPMILQAMEPSARRIAHLALAEAARTGGVGGEWERRFIAVHMALGAGGPEHIERLVTLGRWLVDAGRPVPGLEALDHAAQLPVERLASQVALAIARGDALRALGRIADSRDALGAARRFAVELGDPVVLRAILLAEAENAIVAGAGLSEAMEAAVREAAEEPDAARALYVAGELSLLSGEMMDAELYFRRALDGLGADGPERLATASRLGLGQVQAAVGEVERAVDTFGRLVADLRYRDRNHAVVEATCHLAVATAATGGLGRGLEALVAADELAVRGNVPHRVAMVAVARAALHLACGDLPGADALLRAHPGCADARCPYGLRARFFEVQADLRVQAGDMPAALATHLAAGEAATDAHDRARAAFHEGMAALLTADADGVGLTVERLAATGIHRLQARLLLAGALIGRDATVLRVAEMEARASGDRILLLHVLHASRRTASRSEARRVAAAIGDSLFGPLREAFLALPAVRWSAGEQSSGARDTPS
jgi:tRNA A-37 threonylcarbamoyl transferase component Bud32/tetratricopeptide (TPR) repeat protein